MRKRQRRALTRIWDWCRSHRHDPLRDQHRALSRQLRGLYQYYGIRGNVAAIKELYQQIERTWHYWLGRRSQRSQRTWEQFRRLLINHPLPAPRIVHWSV